MSLFDIIKHAGIDIYSEEELLKLPLDVMHKWIIDSSQYIDYPYPIDLNNVNNKYSVIIQNVVGIASHKVSRGGYRTEELMDIMFKTYFTGTLLKSLSEFESEI